jgi:hypothetical protein
MKTRADEDATEALVVAPCNPYLLEQRCVGPLRETAEASTHIIFTLNDAFPVQIQMTRSAHLLCRLLLVRIEYVLHCINYIWILILGEVAHRIPLVSFLTLHVAANQIKSNRLNRIILQTSDMELCFLNPLKQNLREKIKDDNTSDILFRALRATVI